MDPLTSINAMSRFFFSFLVLNAIRNGMPPCPKLARMVRLRSTCPSFCESFIRRETLNCICLNRRNTSASIRSRSGSGISEKSVFLSRSMACAPVVRLPSSATSCCAEDPIMSSGIAPFCLVSSTFLGFFFFTGMPLENQN